jgi:hypothetical protein
MALDTVASRMGAKTKLSNLARPAWVEAEPEAGLGIWATAETFTQLERGAARLVVGRAAALCCCATKDIVAGWGVDLQSGTGRVQTGEW